jgi:putative transposase
MPFQISPKLLKYFKGHCSSPEIIMLFVYMKCRFSLSYRELEEMASIRGAKIDHATLQKWLIKFSPLIDKEVRKRKKSMAIAGEWMKHISKSMVNGYISIELLTLVAIL